MNKEVKDLVYRLKQDSDCEDIYWVGYVDGMNCDAEIINKEMKLLLDYINQLETNRDEAIKELEILRNRLLYEEDFCMEEVHIDEAKAILERGKE